MSNIVTEGTRAQILVMDKGRNVVGNLMASF